MPESRKSGRTRITTTYHVVYLGMTIVSFLFSITLAGIGISQILQNPDKVQAAIIIEGVSALGFFFTRWSQKTYVRLLRESALDDSIATLTVSPHTIDNPEVFKQLLHEVLQKRSTLTQEREEERRASNEND